MPLKADILLPSFPNFFRVMVLGKVLDAPIDIGSLNAEDMMTIAEEWKMGLLQHWKARKTIFLEEEKRKK